MALADVLRDGKPVTRRWCAICHEPIVLTIDAKGKPVVQSCSCRAQHRRETVPSDWLKMEQLMPAAG